MWLREVVKFLRFARDVLAEYVATEQAKYDAARQAAEAARRSAEEAARSEAEEAARRRATEAAAQDAERRSTRERQAQQTTLRRKQRRRGRQGAPVTIPVNTSPEIAARMAATPSAVRRRNADGPDPDARGTSGGAHRHDGGADGGAATRHRRDTHPTPGARRGGPQPADSHGRDAGLVREDPGASSLESPGRRRLDDVADDRPADLERHLLPQAAGSP